MYLKNYTSFNDYYRYSRMLNNSVSPPKTYGEFLQTKRRKKYKSNKKQK